MVSIGYSKSSCLKCSARKWLSRKRPRALYVSIAIASWDRRQVQCSIYIVVASGGCRGCRDVSGDKCVVLGNFLARLGVI